MPPLLLQPLAENAVRHGIATLVDGGDIDHRGHARRAIASTCSVENPFDPDGRRAGHRRRPRQRPRAARDDAMADARPCAWMRPTHASAPPFLCPAGGGRGVTRSASPSSTTRRRRGRCCASISNGEPDVEIVAECANGFEAVKAVAEQQPDLLLLDVQMPKLDGFEVLELVGRDTAVIFATAYDEYALRAFEVHAIDYLLKPFGRERLQEALDARAAAADARTPAHAAHRRDRDLPRPHGPPGTRLSRIVIRDGAEVHVVPIDKVDFVEAQDDYIAVRTGGRTLLKDQTMANVETQLDPRRFVRIHRSFLLNLDRLARLEPTGKDTRMAILRDGRELPVSRSGYARLQDLL